MCVFFVCLCLLRLLVFVNLFLFDCLSVCVCYVACLRFFVGRVVVLVLFYFVCVCVELLFKVVCYVCLV